MNILVLSRYGRLGASSRMRSYQYIPLLEADGIHVTVAPLFSDAYVRGLQKNKKSLIEAARAYTGRIRALLSSRKFDLLWIEKETLPWLPAWFEKILLPGVVPYVLDYDDAVFHYYDEHRNPYVRALLACKHPSLMQGAALVVAGNAYLAEFARQAGAPNVEVVPTVIDLARYPRSKLKGLNEGTLPCIGWIGQRVTASFLAPYAPLFERLTSDGLARFAAIGIDAQKLGLPMISIPWTEHTEVASIASFDIGIMPLLDASFERGKCGYKLIQYMACSLPVVASPVGVNRQIVEHGVNGFLAETPEDWEKALRTLLTDADLRQRMGQAGRKKVEQHYCIQATGPRLAALLRDSAKAAK
ncbi:glycosyltransferase involved in cell wall biosynthesis [Polaromonas sp. CG_9.5]|uniref:glycosyltransferase family 4 protein n=1 Tax=Polaromonas sp. CG_9.5 TaxID=3071705 RepID=UPI002E0B90DD|nr:glycosyltransferase involved in cell wall biosynthesis [Polaromonas sp. CG_9.5]